MPGERGQGRDLQDHLASGGPHSLAESRAGNAYFDLRVTISRELARRGVPEKAEQQERAWDMWLDCHTPTEIGTAIGVTDQTVTNWLSNFGKSAEFREPPESRQHFDVWSFQTADDDSSYLGKMPPQAETRLTEILIGELLGPPAEPGRDVGRGRPLASPAGEAIAREDRHRFRLMAAHAALVEVFPSVRGRARIARMTRRHACPVCGAELPPAAPAGRPRIYCSPRCRWRAGHAVARARGRAARAESMQWSSDELVARLNAGSRTT